MIVDIYKVGTSGLFVPHNTNVNSLIANHPELKKFGNVKPSKVDLSQGPIIGANNNDIEQGINQNGYYVASAGIHTEEG